MWVRSLGQEDLLKEEMATLLRKSHGKRSLAGYSQWGQEELTRLNMNTYMSVQFSRSVMSDSLRPHESQHARPPSPSPTPGVHSDSRPSSQ